MLLQTDNVIWCLNYFCVYLDLLWNDVLLDWNFCYHVLLTPLLYLTSKHRSMHAVKSLPINFSYNTPRLHVLKATVSIT